MKKLITLSINQEWHELYIDTRRSILDVVRNELGLMGTHRGCDTGNCGACTVLVNDVAMNSCLLLAADYHGASVITVEGVAGNGMMHPIQRALVDCGGIQCGYCTPGMVMNVIGLLLDESHPSEEAVRRRLSGNLCRCTGYVKIVDAVLAAAGDALPPGMQP